MNKEIIVDKIKGTVYGLALGDAWGYQTEFLNYEQILKETEKYTNPPKRLIISDDTQMSIYNMMAIGNIFKKYFDQLPHLFNDKDLQNNVRLEFARSQVGFYYDPLNNRAPGNACMNSLSAFVEADNWGMAKTGLEGITSKTKQSNGCGTIMRSGWLGLLPLEDEIIALLSILQAEITHGNPKGGITSAVNALFVKYLLNKEPDEYIDLYKKIEQKLTIDKVLYNYTTIQNILNKIDNIDSNLIDHKAVKEISAGVFDSGKKFEAWSLIPAGNMSKTFGAGWIADDALYTSLAAVNYSSSSNCKEAIKQMVFTSGDSDSLGAVAGGMIGSLNGFDKLVDSVGEDFTTNFEPNYQEILKAVINYIVSLY